ncbi:MAG: IclR family transcriptional regulator [Pseudomonadota bacterium]
MNEPDRIPTNLRALLILEVLGRSDQPLTATEINQSLGLPKQTVHRLCATLEREGFLSRHGNSKRYQAARRLRNLGAGLLHNSRSHISRHQILIEVARVVRETVNFVVPEDDGMSYLDRVETDWPFRVQLPIGTHVPFHCTASGKCFMASLPPRARREFVMSIKLEGLTTHTHTNAGALLKELAEIASVGFSLDRQEFVEGMVAMAVPVTDISGRFVAALAVHGPIQRISMADVVGHKEVLQDAALRIRNALFAEDHV